MPKLSKGRLDGVWGMMTYTSKELFNIADDIEKQISNLNNTDDPRWLKRHADKVRKLAEKKEQSLEHKLKQLVTGR